MRLRLIVIPGRFKNPAVQRYLHDLSSDLCDHLVSITSALSLFIEVGKLLILRGYRGPVSLTPIFQACPQLGLRRHMARKTCSTCRPLRPSSPLSRPPVCSSHLVIPTAQLQMRSTHSGSRRWSSALVGVQIAYTGISVKHTLKLPP